MANIELTSPTKPQNKARKGCLLSPLLRIFNIQYFSPPIHLEILTSVIKKHKYRNHKRLKTLFTKSILVKKIYKIHF